MEKEQQSQIKQYLFDSHCHLLDFPQQEIKEVIHLAQTHSVLFISTNTTHQQQYQKQLSLVQQHSLPITPIKHFEELSLKKGKVTIIPSFGVHPCFIQHEKNNQEWLTTLEKVVTSNPYYGVGQIGLDYRTATLETNSKQCQTEFFQKQFQLAIKLNRPVTVHCVRAYGEILKYFKGFNKKIEAISKNMKEVADKQNYQGTPIIMHSYGGSKEITQALLKLTNLNLYFSLCLKRSQQLCTVIPIEKLLLQTDAPFQSHLPLLLQQNLLQQNLSENQRQYFQQTNRVQFVQANISSLCKYYNMQRSLFSKTILHNSLKVFRLLI